MNKTRRKKLARRERRWERRHWLEVARRDLVPVHEYVTWNIDIPVTEEEANAIFNDPIDILDPMAPVVFK